MKIPAISKPPATGGRLSAVLVLFGNGPAGPDLLFIRRSGGLRRHAGQPAFPGGALEEDELADPDGGPVAAALREAQEEVGLDPAGVDVLAVLPEMFIPRSGFRVVPVLAWWRSPVAVYPADIGEVAAGGGVPVGDPAGPAPPPLARLPGGRPAPGVPGRGMVVLGFNPRPLDRL